jgi:hypothetical protein
MARRRRQFRDYRGNPISTGQKVAIAAAGAAVLGVAGYFLYSYLSPSSGASASGGSMTSGAQATTLGPGGSSTPLGAGASTTGTDGTDGTTIVGSTAYGPGYSPSNPPPDPVQSIEV